MQCVHEYKVVSIKMSTCSAVLDAIPVGLEGSSIFRSRLYAWGVRTYQGLIASSNMSERTYHH